MSLHLFTLDEKIEALHTELVSIKRTGFAPGSAQQRQYNVLKAIAADLRAHQVFPRSLPLGELERALESMKRSKTALGYSQDKMAYVANVVIHRWPFIRQALEAFGAESAE